MQDLAVWSSIRMAIYRVLQQQPTVTANKKKKEAAILSAGAVRRVPAFDDQDRVIAQELMTVTVSADHRVTDGAEVALFLQCIKDSLEATFPLVMER